ncbi:hypothetical protein HMPREF1531_01345 [Propionibacterium sp. oral taxon 192 str. F0372]|uniref:energy-coupling factor transporter transmembrane component T family protein n=1 Tax=Propionibacterium sp. oral taxon 192 TaxID=671222 RepID=UPI000353E069|nr:energy-coupling factor transporter transmembrane component T [Propionibacterium sp. oral taxon 192]EPH03286.1 hypothetical protein HMPREF1531_01345 [Propionibacterium sp. oral taxon 192 str. F0372]
MNPLGPSALDRLNPVTRLGIAVFISIPVMITLDWVSALTLFVAQMLIYLACGVPARRLLARLAPLGVIAPIGAISMALYGRPEGRVWFHYFLITVTDNSLHLAIAVLARIFTLGTAAIVLIGGTDLTRMADGLAQIIHLPDRFVLGTLAGVRMIGLFVDDWRTMGLARRARGIADTGRLRTFATMAFALLVFAIRRGMVLATAMEARGFGSGIQRTWARPSRLGRADIVGWVVTVMVCIGSVWAAVAADTFLFIGAR